MTSRTPIRLTPYRGPLATPSTSPESSPTLSTPPTDISYCTTPIRPTLDIAIIQYRISILSPSTRYQSQPRLHHRGRTVTKQGLFGRSTQLSLIFESLSDIANTLAGVVTFCLLVWGLLEWSSHASELLRQPTPQLSIRHFSLSSRARDSPRYRHVNPVLCEPSDQHISVLQFISEQIHHAKALSSLSISLGLPLRTLFEEHRANIPNIIVHQNHSEFSHPLPEVDILANLTELLGSSPLDFTSSSFIGRSLALALDELGDPVFEPTISRSSSSHGKHSDAHLHAIYWRTTSNLLLEYSAARQRARILLEHVRVLHERLSPMIWGLHTADRRSSTWRWKDAFRHSATTIEDRVQALVAGLGITLDNVHRLIAYLDWITEQLADPVLKDALKMHHQDRTDFSACLKSLQELFLRSAPSPPKKRCFCLNDYGGISPSRPKKVDIMVSGSPTVRAGR